jgi:protocadherin Fat 1/2/3
LVDEDLDLVYDFGTSLIFKLFSRLLDYESEKRVYVLKVRASDWGSPYRRQAELKLTIRLRDINDNRPQFERIGCAGKVARTTAPGSQIFTLSALDFDAGSMISYRLVSGNADGCFALDPTKGILSIVCDLRTLPMRRRELNVTATDGQHFADVTPVTIRLVNDYDDSDDDVIVIDSDNEAVRSIKKKHRKVVSSNSWMADSMFECKDTDVAKRLTTILAESEKNNLQSSAQDNDDDESNDASKMPSRFGSNIHRPELENIPSLIQINETAPPGTLLFKVGLKKLFFLSFFFFA